jgi:hypothetical protein
MRIALLCIVIVFIGGLGFLTAQDIANNGVTWLDVLAIVILVLFSTGIVGALLEKPRKRD